MSRLHAFVHFQEVRTEGVARLAHTLRPPHEFVQRLPFGVARDSAIHLVVPN